MGMFDTEKKAETINEAIPYLTLGGVFTNKIKTMSDYVDTSNKLDIQKAVIDMFTTYPKVDDSMIDKLAETLRLPVETVREHIYDVMSSFWNKGKFNENPQVVIDPEQLKMGIIVEAEHSDNVIVAERIAKDHLAEIPNYYTLLNQMEAKANGKVS